LQDGRTILETIYDIYIKEIENRNQESLPINDIRLLRHYSRCKHCYLESIGRRKEEDKMENPTIYNSMDEYHRACYNPLKDTEICIFDHNDTEYCIVVNYDDCLNRRVQIGKFIEDYDPMSLKGKNYDTIQYAYLTSGYIMFADPTKGGLTDSCLKALYSESKNGITVLEEIYDTYINCLNIGSDKIEDQQRAALRQSYIIDKETHKRVMVERKESEIEQESSSTIDLSAVEMFDITHQDKYFFIESPDVRNYLSSINYEFSRVERLYLIYNSTNLGYVEIIDALTSDLSKGGYKEEGLGWVEEQVISRIRYMESVMNMFNTPEEGVVYTVEFLGNRVINGPMFADPESAQLYCMENNHSKVNFRIVKKRVNKSHEIDNNETCGVAVYNHDGILLNCTIPNFSIIIGKDERRFENDITVNIPYPFITGDIVTDGKTVYYVKSPDNTAHMWNIIGIRNKANGLDGRNNDFKIECYCFADEDNTDNEDLVVLDCDVRKLVYIPEAKNQLAKITTILRTFVKKEK